ncbi:hypothetical protein ACTMTJ_30200 [Phytohabitans sp. LJ34]|uniref:hypothetical protein n=1 Tax=Phytohabitans sp. LJ34 TaxID=3452217 RepID=UPI003F8A4366
MNVPLDTSAIALLVLLSWQVARAVAFVSATLVSLLSRNPARRAEARRVLRILSHQYHDPQV